jgi:haloalkane dehalogenase
MHHTHLLGTTIAHREQGDGRPIVFLHGNPTSSHVWRRVLPEIGPGRLLAPDLVGMGESGPAASYTFAEHARHLDAWFDALDLGPAVLVGYDWGGALAMDRAARRPDLTSGVVIAETIVKPMSWEEFPEGGRERFRAMRTPGLGERLVLEENLFIENALPLTITDLAPADHDVYRRPYPTPESRRPLLEWPRAMPLGGEPADVVARVEAYDAWLAASPEVPKLLLTFDPQATLMLGPELVDWCRRNVAALETAHCGAARHNVPEDQPVAIARAIAAWLDRHGLREPAATSSIGAGTVGDPRA